MADVLSRVVVLRLAEELYKRAVIHAAEIVAGSVLEAKRYLLAFVLFPIASGVEPRVSERIGRSSESRNRVIGCRVVHFKVGHFYSALSPCAIKRTLRRGHIVGAEGAERGVHHITHTAVICHRRVRVVNLDCDDCNRNCVDSNSDIARIKKLISFERVRIGVFGVKRSYFPSAVLAQIEAVILDRTLGRGCTRRRH